MIRALTTGQASVNTVISIVDVSRQTDKQGGDGRKERLKVSAQTRIVVVVEGKVGEGDSDGGAA